jgi:hypothetical protein
MATKRKRSAAALRPLTEAEVTFTVELEEEDIDVRGNFMASGDDEADRADEDAIIERLNRGDMSAWCCLKVTASWNGFTAVSYLGACSFTEGIHQPVEAQAIEMANDHGMKQEALERLNQAIADVFGKLAPPAR